LPHLELQFVLQSAAGACVPWHCCRDLRFISLVVCMQTRARSKSLFRFFKLIFSEHKILKKEVKKGTCCAG